MQLFIFGFTPIGKGLMASKVKLIVDFVNVVHAATDKELHDKVALAAVGEAIPGPLNEISGFIKVKMQGNGERQCRLFGGIVIIACLDFRKS